MECAAALLALAALAVLPMALVAYRLARAATAKLRVLEVETARLRQLVESAQSLPALPAPPIVVHAGTYQTYQAAPEIPAAAALYTAAPAPMPPPLPGPEPQLAAPPTPPTSAGPAAPRRGGLEELVGARLLPWIAAMALAFAGAYLVKYSFERGWISPPVRIALGVVFGIALLVLSEVLRRPSRRISEALAAAGVADLFACFLSAVHVYHLVAPAAGFALLALTTAVAVVLSLRHGTMVALVGMVGGFLTPALVQTAQPNARVLFGYLLLLVAGLLAVAQRRGWPWLRWSALAAALLWGAFWLSQPFRAGDAAWLSLFLLFMAAASALSGEIPGSAANRGAESPRDLARDPLAALLAIGATLILLGSTLARSGYALDEWGFLGILATGLLALAWLAPRHLPLAWMAAIQVAVMLTLWGSTVPDADHFLAVVAGAGALFAVTGWAATLRLAVSHANAASPARAGSWAALSGTAGVAFFLIAWSVRHEIFGSAETWGTAALVLGSLYLVAAVPVARRRQLDPDLEAALAALATAATSLISLAVPIGLGRQSLAVAWALEAAILVWLAARLRVAALDRLALLLSAAAVLGAFGSGAEGRAAHELPILNSLLYSYGVPLAALSVAAWLAAQRPLGATAGPLGRKRQLIVQLQGEALLLLFVLVSLEVDQLFAVRPGQHEEMGLSECAAISVSWLVLGWMLLRLFRRPTPRSLREPVELGGRVIVLLGLGTALLGSCLALNPLWSHQAVGSALLWNTLLFAYALPAVLGLLAAREVSLRGGHRLPGLARLVALFLGFVWVSLAVRQAFHGAFLDLGPAAAISAAERYAYSAAWVLYGVSLLLIGIARRGRVLRYGSLGVMLLAVLKVFLSDTARLSDLYRVLSFLGLGISLLLLAFLYQRFVIAEDKT